MSQKITLGDHEYKVVAQPIGYLTNALGSQFGDLLQSSLEGVEGLAAVPAQAHAVLRVFIPQLMPLHEFLGYPTQEAMDGGEYDRSADTGPTGPEIIDAFKVVSKANGGDVLRHLKALIGPEMIQKFVALQVAKSAEGSLTTPSGTSDTSPSLPPPSGDSAQTSSGATPPTSTPSAA